MSDRIVVQELGQGAIVEDDDSGATYVLAGENTAAAAASATQAQTFRDEAEGFAENAASSAASISLAGIYPQASNLDLRVLLAQSDELAIVAGDTAFVTRLSDLGDFFAEYLGLQAPVRLFGSVSASALAVATLSVQQAISGVVLGGDGASWAVDFAGDRTFISGSVGTGAAALVSCTRNSVALAPRIDGNFTSFAANVPAVTDFGLTIDLARTTRPTQNRLLTTWTRTGVTVAATATGITGVANTAARVTVTADGGTITLPITDATSRARAGSLFIERISGAGTVTFSMDGGATRTPIEIEAGARGRVSNIIQTLASPTVELQFGTAGDVFDIDAVMLEDGAFTSSPIFTAGAAAARAADVITIPDLSPFNLTQGAWVCEFEIVNGPLNVVQPVLTFFSGGNDNIRLQVNAANQMELNVRATSTQALLTTNGTVAAGGIYRAAFRFAANDVAAAFSDILGGSSPNDTLANIPAITSIALGNNGSGAGQSTVRIRSLVFVPYANATDDALAVWAGAIPPAPIAFTVGETFFPPAGLTWPSTVNGYSVPQSVYWDGAKFRLAGDPALTSFVAAGISTATPYYVDASRLDDSGNGLTPATAKQRISSAIALANADGQAAGRIIVAAGTYFQDKSINGTLGASGTEPTKPMGFVASGGRVKHVCSTEWSFPATPDGTLTNSYVGGPATALRVFDRLTLDSNGVPTEIPRLANAAAVNAASGGGWFISGGVVTIRRADGARPTHTNTLITGDMETARFNDTPHDLYFTGFDFEGGKTGALVIDKTTSVRNVAIDNCTANFAGGPSDLWDGFIIQDTRGLLIINDCAAHKNGKDGVNLNSTIGIVALYTFILNTDGWSNGLANTSNNYLTSHQECITFIAGGSGGDSMGPDVHMINTSKTYIVGNTSKATARGGADPSSYKVSGSALMWIEKCTADSVNKAFSAVGGSDPVKARISKRGTRTIAGTNSALSGGVIDSF